MKNNQITGLMLLGTVFTLSFSAMSIGQQFAYTQLTNPSITNGFYKIAVAVGVIIATLISVVVAVMFLSGAINELGTPQLFQQSEYSIIKLGGISGIMAFVGLCIISLSTSLHTPMTVPTGDLDVYAGITAGLAAPLLYFNSRIPSLREFEQKETVTNDRTQIVKNNTGVNDVNETETHGGVSAEVDPGVSDYSITNNDKGDSTQQSEATSTGNTNQQEKGESKNASSTDTQFNWVTETDVSFDDIGGLDELKEQLTRDIVHPLTTKREKAEKLGISAPNVIFHGPPGTGKTFTAEALATELGLPFVKLSGADIQSKWINESSQKVKQLFDEAEEVASENGGCVVFLDELDSVLKDRSGKGGSHEEDNKVVNEFLNHLEDTEENNIVFIGATNRIEALDEAGIRSGRIDRKIRVGKPDESARRDILQKQLSDRPNTVSESDVASLANQMGGYVAADIESVVKMAAKHVLKRDGEVISTEDINRSIETFNSDS